MLLRRLAVLGGTDPAARTEYHDAAGILGALVAERGIKLLAPGGSNGPAGAFAAAFRSAGGVATEATDFTDSARAADGFVALPGGPQKLETLFTVWLDNVTLDAKPCGLLNTADYFTGLLKDEADSVVERFVRESQRGRLIVDRDPDELLRAMLDFRPPETRRQGP